MTFGGAHKHPALRLRNLPQQVLNERASEGASVVDVEPFIPESAIEHRDRVRDVARQPAEGLDRVGPLDVFRAVHGDILGRRVQIVTGVGAAFPCKLPGGLALGLPIRRPSRRQIRRVVGVIERLRHLARPQER